MSRLDDYNYWNDRRTIAGMVRKPFEVIQMPGGSTSFGVIRFTEDFLAGAAENNGDGLKSVVDGELRCAFKFEVCDTCDGKGEVVNPSIDSGGISGETFSADPSFARAYMSGMYDIKCPQCKGLRVVVEPAISSTELMQFMLGWIDAAIEDAEQQAYWQSMGM